MGTANHNGIKDVATACGRGPHRDGDISKASWGRKAWRGEVGFHKEVIRGGQSSAEEARGGVEHSRKGGWNWTE